MSRIRRISPRLSRGGLLGNTEGPESYLRELDTLPSQFCRATGGTETVISQGGKFYRVHTFTDTDPTSLLLNFDGSNGSTTFTDDSGWGHAVTANGDAQISTTESKFGGSSLYLDGTGDYLTSPANADFNYAAGNFTIEGWFRSDDIAALQTIVAQISYNPSPVSLDGYAIRVGSSKLGFNYYDNNSTQLFSIGNTTTLSSNTWYHFAVCRDGNIFRLFLNGVLEGSTTNAISLASGKTLSIGRWEGYADRNFPGYIDSLRITKGQALYTAAFTPPTTALTRVGSGSLTFTRGGAVEYLVVGGGGGGGYGASGGGGGAGGYSVGSRSVIASEHSISVGAGGGEGNAGSAFGVNGASSTAFSLISDGGGGGGGLNGGSGGGGRLRNQAGGTATGNGVGNDGGAAVSGSSGVVGGGGGGGGANENGADGTTSVGGDGGDGLSSSISGAAVTYAGGGGGGGRTGVSAGSGGAGGAGDGSQTATSAESGTANTGGGGGGGGFDTSAGTGGSGGSGIVIARYRITQAEYEAEAA